MMTNADDALMTEQQVAAYLGLSVRTIQAWRYRDEGPAYSKLGRAVRYRKSDVDAWVIANQSPTATEASAHAAQGGMV